LGGQTNEEFLLFGKKELERGERNQKGKLPSTYICLQPTNSFFFGGGGGLGLPKFHVLSFWNWLGIRNQIGSWVLKAAATTRKEEEHTQSS
jgi:hypothetical protein